MRYDLNVQLTPTIHEGQMTYYWHIDYVDGNNRITVRDGYASELAFALADAHREAQDLT